MSNEPTKLNLDLTSIVNLKAELTRKQEEFRLKKFAQESKKEEYQTHKTQSTWGKKKKDQKEEDSSRTETVKTENEEVSEENLLEKSRKILESKAKYYEEVVSGRKATEEGDEEIFLVDFDKKVYDEKKEKEEELRLKLKAKIDEEEYNKKLKQKWEEETNQNLEKEKIHYQDIRYNEVRNMGVGNYQFSRNEQERKEQMEFFKKIDLESKTSRIRNEIHKLKRERALVERLNKVKQRRLLKFGYSLDQISTMCTEFDKELNEIDQEISVMEEALKNPKEYEIKLTEPESDKTEDLETFKPIKKVILDREWDKPKLKDKIWTKHVEKLRMERNKRFAPPKTYEESKKKQKKKQKKPETENKKSQDTTTTTTTHEAQFGPPPMYFYSVPPFFPFPPPPFFQQPNTSGQSNNN